MADMAKKIFIALVTILVLILVFPIVLGSVASVLGLPDISGYNGVIPVAGLIPLLFIVVGIIAIMVWVFSKKNNQGG